ncbi:MAG: TraM recognition domain-containing protein [Clostridia bacterium]|nr:TraM recognition domain-containing protein [Clostridia bacterium]
MKYIDKFLKKLNASRNTFATFILTLFTIYLTVDRVVEILFMIFTGVSQSYWNPIVYTIAMACPLFAFLFSGSSEFATSKKQKVTLFYVYAISFFIIALSMFMQWINMGAWLFLLGVPNYVEIITEFSDLVRPAFISLSLYLPLITIVPFFNFLYNTVEDSSLHTRSIWDYGGISLADKSKDTGPYSNEMYLCTDDETGAIVKIPDNARFLPMLVCGGSGTGKTSAVLEPMIARDLERKAFYREVSKELGFAALKTKIAVLNKPYDNNYLNNNFNLSMLSPTSGKENTFKALMKKLTLGNGTYRDVGVTVLSPDYDILDHMIDVCNNYGIGYNIVDPSNPNSIGLNPFIYDDPAKIAITISAAIRVMYNSKHEEVEDAYREDVATQAIENLAILLKEIYPRLHEGTLPNLNDMLQMFTNFDLIEKMCEILAHNEELNEKYSVQISYFKKNFYKNAPRREETEKDLVGAVAQLDTLLRLPGVKNILCNRYNNINFDDCLANGNINFVCTRRGDLGGTAHKAFGMFFLLAMQNAVLRRPGTEATRVPNFLYIDEFSDFLGRYTEPIFTMYRKYRVSTVITIQNLSQLDTPNVKEHYRETILSNCANKIFTGNADVTELEWWSKELGTHREWVVSDSMDFKKGEYDPKHNVKWDFVSNFKVGKLQTLKKNVFAYLIKNSSGKSVGGAGKFKYLDAKYKEPQKIKKFDFEKYSDSTTVQESDSNKKFDFKHVNFIDDRNEYNPIQTDTSDSSYLFDNEDAIVVKLKKKKDN